VTPALAQLVERIAGLSVDRGGVRDTLDRFVAERMRVLGLRRVEDYVALASDPAGAEQRRLIEAITVSHTWFYRDLEQLQIIERLLVAVPPGQVAVWVAGCATGEEAYTIAMIGRRINRDVYVHATDVNESVLATARRGVYSGLAVRDVPASDRQWITPHGEDFLVDPTLRSRVTFARHNLVDLPPTGPRGAWDLIVCRNVLIYFAPGPANRVFERFARAVREGGSLVVGASEIVFKPPPGLELLTSTSGQGRRLVLHRPAPGAPRPAVLEQRVATSSPSGGLPVVARPPATASDARPEPVPTERSQRFERARTEPPARDARPEPIPTERSQRFEQPRTERPAYDEELAAALRRGHERFEQGQYDASIAVYKELLAQERYSDVAEVWLFLGIARFLAGDFEGSASAMRSTLCLDRWLWPAMLYLARYYDRLGRRDDARQQWDQLAVAAERPLALQSVSAVINELRAYQRDIQALARRLASERDPRR
jgi:chemotaxis protein methyltransferase CheR